MNSNAIAWLAKQIVWETRLDQLRVGKPEAADETAVQQAA